jgi:hypothetical protein
MSQESQPQTTRTATPINYIWDLQPELGLRLRECHIPSTTKLVSSKVHQEPATATSTPAVCSIAPNASQSTSRRSSRVVEPIPLSDIHAEDPFGIFYQVADDQVPGWVELESLEERIDFAHSILRRLGFTSVWGFALAIGRSSIGFYNSRDGSFLHNRIRRGDRRQPASVCYARSNMRCCKNYISAGVRAVATYG